MNAALSLICLVVFGAGIFGSIKLVDHFDRRKLYEAGNEAFGLVILCFLGAIVSLAGLVAGLA
jgi:hypothetical protein